MGTRQAPDVTRQQVKALLAEGVKRNAIAARLGISRQSVSRVLTTTIKRHAVRINVKREEKAHQLDEGKERRFACTKCGFASLTPTHEACV